MAITERRVLILGIKIPATASPYTGEYPDEGSSAPARFNYVDYRRGSKFSERNMLDHPSKWKLATGGLVMRRPLHVE
jgi:hypothetical protein